MDSINCAIYRGEQIIQSKLFLKKCPDDFAVVASSCLRKVFLQLKAYWKHRVEAKLWISKPKIVQKMFWGKVEYWKPNSSDMWFERSGRAKWCKIVDFGNETIFHKFEMIIPLIRPLLMSFHRPFLIMLLLRRPQLIIPSQDNYLSGQRKVI